MNSRRLGGIGAVVALLLCGCAHLTDSARSTAKRSATSVLSGTITVADGKEHLCLVVAVPVSSPGEAAPRLLVRCPGPWMMAVAQGRYLVQGLVDFDEDYVLRAEELAGQVGRPDPVEVGEAQVVKRLDLRMAARPTGQLPIPLKVVHEGDSIAQQGQSGRVVKLYDAIFGRANGEIGWWSPARFLDALGAHIYFTEPYDPQRIPVLFVHGAGGTPYDFDHLSLRLDRRRYQAWLFYYPSGLRLPVSSELLGDALESLRVLHGFDRLAIVAHSMGGLVVRGMLTQPDRRELAARVRLFVSIASPWSGFRAADGFHADSLLLIPAWLDVASRSRFIQQIFDRSLPPQTAYHLLFGRWDAVAAGRSLDDRARRDAASVVGFEEDHGSILRSKRVFDRLAELLLQHLPPSPHPVTGEAPEARAELSGGRSLGAPGSAKGPRRGSFSAAGPGTRPRTGRSGRR